MGRTTTRLVVSGLLVTIILAVVVSQFSSEEPDGLEFVASEQGFAATANDHALDGAPLAGYDANLTGNTAIDTAIAGAAGVLVTLVVGLGVFRLARRTKRATTDTTPTA